uniref:exodeoxyribonuclease VII large subunit n=1 Tax=Actinotalea sp. C106 TaxID=2908644 RepID=UPI0035ABE339
WPPTSGDVSRPAAQVRALSPAATLDRGYAVVQHGDGLVLRDPAEVDVGQVLRIRVARGELSATAGPADPRFTGPEHEDEGAT